jgi:hypothetical protein
MFRAIRSDGRPIGRMTGKPEVNFPIADNTPGIVPSGVRCCKAIITRKHGFSRVHETRSV